ncbi:hypothetical protein SLNWT_6382 [Streptomyces albus]|uniref:Uncharacterized protein n=1 Tax=Streptomyces albus (strain ATCC 21838 / DSM 41398 / FERM P-419 / JCM 4703 / NBRC 107858) TaxID=1081613 RepID=A0A0B5EVA9_STRA4|nr:hypothetical protein SLNWT_6382 [Streptomyces albus]AOU81062.1 hypothetical protein SLNHY_6371 [Streptomyces albus]
MIIGVSDLTRAGAGPLREDPEDPPGSPPRVSTQWSTPRARAHPPGGPPFDTRA